MERTWAYFPGEDSVFSPATTRKWLRPIRLDTKEKSKKKNIYIYVSVYLHANNVAVKTPLPQLFVQSALTVTFKGLTGDGRSSVWQ